MTENNYRNPDYFQYEEESIDIMEYILKLWKKRKMIIIWCVAGAIIGLIAGFSIPKTYTAGAVLAPERTDNRSSSLSSLAAMAGINMQSGIDAINVEMYPDVVHSTPFIVELLDMPVTFERKDSIITTDLLTYMQEYQKAPWWSAIVNAPFKALGWVMSLFQDEEESDEASLSNELNPSNLPKKTRDVVKFFAENIMVNVDKKTGRTDISLEMQDPQVVYAVVDAVLTNLKAYMTDYRSSKARQDAENLNVICAERKADYYRAQQAYASFIDANKSIARQSAQAELERLQQEMNLAYQVYSQVATNLESARIQEQQSKPVFAVVNPPVVPIKKTAPSKAKMLVIFTFLAGCIAAAWVLFGEEYWAKLKESLTGQNEETAQAEE